MAEENPFAAPEESSAPDVDKHSRDYVLQVAKAQKNVLTAILCELGLFFFNMATMQVRQQQPFVMAVLTLFLWVVIFIVIVLSVFRLAALLDGTALAILWIVFSIIPCLGLIFLLIISQRATSILTRNGIKVGLLGADLSKY